MAYRLTLPASLFVVYNIFHVFMFHKYMTDPTHVIGYEPFQIGEVLNYEERPGKEDKLEK